MIYDKRFIFPKNSPKAIKKKPPGDAFIVPVMWLLSMTFYLPFGHTADFTRAMSSVFFVFTWLKKKLKENEVSHQQKATLYLFLTSVHF